jgi:hypothetical protein
MPCPPRGTRVKSGEHRRCKRPPETHIFFGSTANMQSRSRATAAFHTITRGCQDAGHQFNCFIWAFAPNKIYFHAVPLHEKEPHARTAARMAGIDAPPTLLLWSKKPVRDLMITLNGFRPQPQRPTSAIAADFDTAGSHAVLLLPDFKAKCTPPMAGEEVLARPSL